MSAPKSWPEKWAVIPPHSRMECGECGDPVPFMVPCERCSPESYAKHPWADPVTRDLILEMFKADMENPN